MWKPFDILYHLLDPLYFLLISASFIPRTILNLMLRTQFSTFFSPSSFKSAWFATFWKTTGPQVREGATPSVKPLVSLAHGVVLDIGPGSGEWVNLFDKKRVDRIYGVEPNRDHHEGLRRRIKEAGLEDVYVICPVGVEDLGEKWIRKGDADCVVTIQCLCSVPRPKEMIGNLYGYLREGGEWIVYEHVKSHRGSGIELYQALVDIIWPHFLGGCSITRDTEQWLKEAGSWSKVNLKQPEAEPSYQVIPHVMGTLTK